MKWILEGQCGNMCKSKHIRRVWWWTRMKLLHVGHRVATGLPLGSSKPQEIQEAQSG